ncbi:PepSY domain-containing protein [Alishewanella longhuensis]
MMKLIPVLICSCILLTAPLLTIANEKKEPPRQQAQSQNRAISKEAATQLAQQRYPGRVLKVNAEQRQYKVRVMQADGRVVNVVVDGQNGRVKREE